MKTENTPHIPDRRPTREILAAAQPIRVAMDRQPILKPADDLPPHSIGTSDGDSYYFVSYVSDGQRNFSVLFHLLLIAKSLGTPIAQLAMSIFDDDQGDYFSKEENRLWLADTTVAEKGLDIRIAGVGRVYGTIDQLQIEGGVKSGAQSLELNFTMKPLGHPLPNLATGMIPFSDGIDYEYALPHLATSGTLGFAGKSYSVTGTSWLDREWGRFGACKWTWMNIELRNQVKMSLWDQQNDDAHPDSHVGGKDSFVTILCADDSLHSASALISELEKWTSSKTGRIYANKWRVTIPGKADLTVTLLPFKQEPEIVSAFNAHRVEAKAKVEGLYDGVQAYGVTTVEMYDLFPLFR